MRWYFNNVLVEFVTCSAGMGLEVPHVSHNDKHKLVIVVVTYLSNVQLNNHKNIFYVSYTFMCVKRVEPFVLCIYQVCSYGC